MRTILVLFIGASAVALGKQPPPNVPTVRAWHVAISTIEERRLPGEVVIGDDTCIATDYSVRCGVSFSEDILLIGDGRVFDLPYMFIDFLSRASFKPSRPAITKYTTLEFQANVRTVSSADILGRPATHLRLLAVVPGLRRPSGYQLADLPHDVTAYDGAFELDLHDWQQAAQDLDCEYMARQVARCDQHHKQYGDACLDEDVVQIEREFLMNTPAVSLIEPEFIAHAPALQPYVKH